MSRQIEWVHDPARFRALAGDWEGAAALNRSPFGDHAWFQAWWDSFGTGDLRVCVLWEGSQLQAALPLFAQRGRLNALSNYHTPLFSVPARDQTSLHAVVQAALAYPAQELAVHAVPAPDPLHQALCLESERHRRWVLVEPLHRSPFVEIEEDFDGYVSSRGRRFKDLTRRWRKLNREHQTRFRFEDSVHDLEAELARGYALEASGWKTEQKTAILSTPQTKSFYTAIAEAYRARGELRLVWLEIDDRPAAFSFCLLRDQRLYCLKTGIEDRLRQHAPGLLIDYCTVERCFALGLQRYELLGADEPYKRYFATSGTEQVRVRSYRRRPAPAARYLTRRVGRPVALAARQRLAR